MKRFLLTAACAFLSLGFLTSCQKEEDSVLELAQELTQELQTITDYQTAEAAAPRVAALNKRLQNAMARPYAANFGGSSLLRSADNELSGQEGSALDSALRDLAREWGRVEASFPVTQASDTEVSVPHMMLSVGVYTGGKKHEDSTAARYSAATEHMHGEDAPNAKPYPDQVPSYYGSSALADALGGDTRGRVTPSSVEFFTFDSADDVVPTPGHVKCEPESTEESGDAGDSSTPDSADDAGSDTPAVGGDDDGGDDDGLSLDDDDSTPAPAADDDDGLPALDSDDSGDDDGGLDLGGDDGGLDLDLDL